MKVLTTSKGYTYHPDWLFEENGRISMKIPDRRKLSEVAFELEDCRQMHYECSYYEPQDFVGYTEITHVELANNDGWLIILEKSKGESDV